MSTVTALKQAAATITSSMSSLKSGGTADEMIKLLKQLEGGLDDVLDPVNEAQRYIGASVNFASFAKGTSGVIRTGLEKGRTTIELHNALNLNSWSGSLVKNIMSIPQPVADASTGAARITWPVLR